MDGFTDNVGVTGYKIFRGGVQVGASATASYSDTSVLPSTSYSYYVSAYDAAGNNSGDSNTASATTPSGPPASVTYVRDTDKLNVAAPDNGATPASRYRVAIPPS